MIDDDNYSDDDFDKDMKIMTEISQQEKTLTHDFFTDLDKGQRDCLCECNNVLQSKGEQNKILHSLTNMPSSSPKNSK